jgi:hypothetical protein
MRGFFPVPTGNLGSFQISVIAIFIDLRRRGYKDASRRDGPALPNYVVMLPETRAHQNLVNVDSVEIAIGIRMISDHPMKILQKIGLETNLSEL